MRIRSVCASLPDRVVTNEEILDEIRTNSGPYLSSKELDRLMETLGALLRISGTKHRRWRAEGQRAVDFVREAATRALDCASLGPLDIDLLIYVGVGRACLEPATAAIVQHDLGLARATCFDVLDACLAWLRAVQLSHHLLKNGAYKNIMIVNAEFNAYGVFGSHVVKSLEEVEYRFAGCLTVGEAATATILSNGESEVEPYFEFKTDASLHTLCKIPLPAIDQFSTDEKCPELSPLVFFAYSADLFRAATEMIPDTYLKSAVLRTRAVDIVFPHAASKTIIDTIEKLIGLGGKSVNLYSEYANTVSATIPVAMSWAIENGRLKRGMKMLMTMGSAGFSVGFGHMVY